MQWHNDILYMSDILVITYWFFIQVFPQCLVYSEIPIRHAVRSRITPQVYCKMPSIISSVGIAISLRIPLKTACWWKSSAFHLHISAKFGQLLLHLYAICSKSMAFKHMKFVNWWVIDKNITNPPLQAQFLLARNTSYISPQNRRVTRYKVLNQ